MIKLAAAALSVNEGAGVAAVGVVRTGGSAGEVTVDYTTSDMLGGPGSGRPRPVWTTSRRRER